MKRRSRVTSRRHSRPAHPRTETFRCTRLRFPAATVPILWSVPAHCGRGARCCRARLRPRPAPALAPAPARTRRCCASRSSRRRNRCASSRSTSRCSTSWRKNTGKKIEFYMPTSYSSVVEALLGKWVDVAVLGPESYLIAKTQGANIDVFATYYKKKRRRAGSRPRLQVDPHHQEGLEVHDARIGQGLGDAAGRPGQHLGLADPRIDLRRQGREDAARSSTSARSAFSGGHDLSTIAVFDGKADAAFVATHRFMNALTASKGQDEDRRTSTYLWTSPLIPQDPFVYRSTLCPELKKQIQDTFIDARPERRAARSTSTTSTPRSSSR